MGCVQEPVRQPLEQVSGVGAEVCTGRRGWYVAGISEPHAPACVESQGVDGGHASMLLLCEHLVLVNIGLWCSAGAQRACQHSPACTCSFDLLHGSDTGLGLRACLLPQVPRSKPRVYVAEVWILPA